MKVVARPGRARSALLFLRGTMWVGAAVAAALTAVAVWFHQGPLTASALGLLLICLAADGAYRRRLGGVTFDTDGIRDALGVSHGRAVPWSSIVRLRFAYEPKLAAHGVTFLVADMTEGDPVRVTMQLSVDEAHALRQRLVAAQASGDVPSHVRLALDDPSPPSKPDTVIRPRRRTLWVAGIAATAIAIAGVGDPIMAAVWPDPSAPLEGDVRYEQIVAAHERDDWVVRTIEVRDQLVEDATVRRAWADDTVAATMAGWSDVLSEAPDGPLTDPELSELIDQMTDVTMLRQIDLQVRSELDRDPGAKAEAGADVADAFAEAAGIDPTDLHPDVPSELPVRVEAARLDEAVHAAVRSLDVEDLDPGQLDELTALLQGSARYTLRLTGD